VVARKRTSTFQNGVEIAGICARRQGSTPEGAEEGKGTDDSLVCSVLRHARVKSTKWGWRRGRGSERGNGVADRRKTRKRGRKKKAVRGRARYGRFVNSRDRDAADPQTSAKSLPETKKGGLWGAPRVKRGEKMSKAKNNQGRAKP